MGKNKHENKSFKKARCRCNGKVIITYLSSSKCFALHIYFRPGQECAKYDQFAANKMSIFQRVYPKSASILTISKKGLNFVNSYVFGWYMYNFLGKRDALSWRRKKIV